jgi:hypothetical protein
VFLKIEQQEGPARSGAVCEGTGDQHSDQPSVSLNPFDLAYPAEAPGGTPYLSIYFQFFQLAQAREFYLKLGFAEEGREISYRRL